MTCGSSRVLVNSVGERARFQYCFDFTKDDKICFIGEQVGDGIINFHGNAFLHYGKFKRYISECVIYASSFGRKSVVLWPCF